MQYYVYGNVTIFFVAGNTIFIAFAQMQKKKKKKWQISNITSFAFALQVCTVYEGAFI